MHRIPSYCKLFAEFLGIGPALLISLINSMGQYVWHEYETHNVEAYIAFQLFDLRAANQK